MSFTSFPESAICYVLADIPGQGEFQGTGVIIGPHTILTAAHLLYDADTGSSADAVSVYPGFMPGSNTYDPSGALGGYQSIHTIKVPDQNDTLSAAGSQGDFAIIDTSTDLSRFGTFALDPGFTSGDVVAKGYPASSSGNLDGTEATVYRDGGLTDLASSSLDLSPGYSGAPLYDEVERNGSLVPAVVGTVSTGADAMKLTTRKVDRIRHWIAEDASLYNGGQSAPDGLVPQIDGTVSDSVNAARPVSGSATLAAALAPSFGSSDDAGGAQDRAVDAARARFADLVGALHGAPSAGDAGALGTAASDAAAALAKPDRHPHGHHGAIGA